MRPWWLMLSLCACSPADTPRVELEPRPAAASAVELDEDDDDEERCGEAPLPPCPLREWMRGVVAPAMRRGDLAALRGHLERLAAAAPRGFEGWSRISRDGAAAARSGTVHAVRAACAACHREHKVKYRMELRDRPLPWSSTKERS